MNLSDSIINLAAVWFVFKFIEVAPLAVFDIISAIVIWRKERNFPNGIGRRPQQDRYDSWRGKMERIISGDGFLDFGQILKSKRWSLVSNLVPLLIFVLELWSVELGRETRNCITSSDPNIISAPSLKLFGDEEYATDVKSLNTELLNRRTSFRPCVSQEWTVSGVQYLGRLCADVGDLAFTSAMLDRVDSPFEGAALLVQINTADNFLYPMLVIHTPYVRSTRESTTVGAVNIYSEVLVEGRSVLVRNVTTQDVMTNEKKEKLLSDVRFLEEFHETPTSEVWQFDTRGGRSYMAFQWKTTEDFSIGAPYVVFAVLAQTTKDADPKTAKELSEVNAINIHGNIM